MERGKADLSMKWGVRTDGRKVKRYVLTLLQLCVHQPCPFLAGETALCGVTATRWAVSLGKSELLILGSVRLRQLPCQWVREAKWLRAEGLDVRA